MKYSVRTTSRFDREFKKLDRYTQRMLKAWIEKNLVDCADPRLHGKGLTANRSGQWRYRIGDYRLICEIEDDTHARLPGPCCTWEFVFFLLPFFYLQMQSVLYLCFTKTARFAQRCDLFPRTFR